MGKFGKSFFLLACVSENYFVLSTLYNYTPVIIYNVLSCLVRIYNVYVQLYNVYYILLVSGLARHGLWPCNNTISC